MLFLLLAVTRAQLHIETVIEHTTELAFRLPLDDLRMVFDVPFPTPDLRNT
jgi:hypothetical protein